VVYLTVKGVPLWEDLVYNILIGVGVVFLLIALLNSIVPQYRRPILVKVIAGLILLTVSIVGGYKPEWGLDTSYRLRTHNYLQIWKNAKY